MKTAEILGEPPQDYDPIAAEAAYPYQELLGYEIAAWEKDFCRVEMPLETRHENRQGLPHGGVHATLLDTAMGFAGSWCPYPQMRPADNTGQSGFRRVAGTRDSHVTALACEAGGGAVTSLLWPPSNRSTHGRFQG